MRRAFLGLMVSAICMSSFRASAQTPTRAEIPFTPQIDRLANGFTVVTIPWTSPGIMGYYTLVRAGSRDEVEAGHSGFAHLFEHMMFRGTETLPEEERMKLEKNLGIDSNAWTSDDETVYTMTGPSEALIR